MSLIRRTAALLGASSLLLSATSAIAQTAPSGNWRDPADNTIFINGLQPQQEVTLSYPGTPRVSSGRANACGAVIVRGSGGVPVTGTIKVDNVSINTATLATQLLPPCINGSFQEARTSNFKTADGSVVVVGKTANQFYGVETQEDAQRQVRANACGIAVIRPNARFAHTPTSEVAINGVTAAMISTLSTRGVSQCRNVNGSSVIYYPQSWFPGS